MSGGINLYRQPKTKATSSPLPTFHQTAVYLYQAPFPNPRLHRESPGAKSQRRRVSSNHALAGKKRQRVRQQSTNPPRDVV